MLDVVFAGEVFCDLVFGGTPHLPTPGSEVYADRFAVAAGGTATRCVAAARLGLHTGLFAVIGTDLFGEHLAAELGAEKNLDLTWLRRDPAVRTPVTVAVTNEHDRAFITYEEEGARRPETWHGERPDVRALHLGIARPLPGWVAELRARGTRVVGGVGWDPTGEWSPDVLTRLKEIDLFVPNAVEAMSYTRTATVEEAVKVLADLVPDVVVTDGPNGALALDRATGDLVRVPAPQVTAADPTGAGDVFTAALIHGVLRDWPLATRLRFAGICASLSVRTLGGASSAPRWGAIREFLHRVPDVPEEDRALIEAAAR
ncbi:carbohydrate kinase family protein [Streptomyces griseorubiginosus]|uniref:carbohydrate kinase family protein n=1 Tax=Streptomyces griseorubiginosus TaxID=67304 RepID=UPI001AD7AC2C|nr:PfkB family carbohydrate kinase [Streptomyces griseorubiginosus]MBO4255619.1 carbohydrate kinase [Streptomyces griseorubiginosus]